MRLEVPKMTAVDDKVGLGTLEDALEVARRKIEVDDAELDEARSRRGKLASALKDQFPGSRTFVNGSIAHGDALTPLTDLDLGLVIPDPDHKYGPGLDGPLDLQKHAASIIVAELGPDYPRLTVDYVDRKRSVLVKFGDPVTPGQPDFTADVIVALDNPSGRGLFIPKHDTWDRSDPESHTAMIREANRSSLYSFAKIVRLLKHWNRQNDKAICSWNIKALALGCLGEPRSLLEALSAWFDHAEAQFARGETPDPAGVAAEPIHVPDGWTLTEVRDHLRMANLALKYSIQLEQEGYPVLALDELAGFFSDDDMLARPREEKAMAEQAARLRGTDTRRPGSAPAISAPLSTVAFAPRIDVRSWSV